MGYAEGTKALLKLAKASKKASRAGAKAAKATKAAKKGAKVAKAAKNAKRGAKVAKPGLFKRGVKAAKKGFRKLTSFSAKLSPLALLAGGGGGSSKAINALGSALKGATSAARAAGNIAKKGKKLLATTQNVLNGGIFSELESFASSSPKPTANVGLAVTNNTTLSDNSTTNEILLGMWREMQAQRQTQTAIGQNIGNLSSQVSELAVNQGSINNSIGAATESINSSLSNVGTAVTGVTESVSDLQETLSPSFVSDSFGGGGAGAMLGALAGVGGGGGILDMIGDAAMAAIAGVAAAATAGYEYFFNGNENGEVDRAGGDYYEGDTYEGDTIVEGDDSDDNIESESETPQDIDALETADEEEESNTEKLMNVAFGAIDPIGELIGENALTRTGGAVGGFLGKNTAKILGLDEEKGELYGNIIGDAGVGIGLTAAATAGLAAIGAGGLVLPLGAAVGGARLGEYLRGTDTMVGRGLNDFDQGVASIVGLSDKQIKDKETKEQKKWQQANEAHKTAVANNQKQQAEELTSNGISGPITELIGKWKEFTQYPEQNRKLISEKGNIVFGATPQEQKYIQGLSVPFQQLVIALAEQKIPQEEKEDDINKLENLIKIAGTRDYSKLLIENRLNWIKNAYLDKAEPTIKNSGNAIVSRLAKTMNQVAVLDDNTTVDDIKSNQNGAQLNDSINDNNNQTDNIEASRNYKEILADETAEIVSTQPTVDTNAEQISLNDNKNDLELAQEIQSTTPYSNNIMSDTQQLNISPNDETGEYNSILTSIMKSSETSNDSLKTLAIILSQLSANITQFLTNMTKPTNGFTLDGGYIT